MKTMSKLMLFLGAALLIAACATTQSPAQMAAATAGGTQGQQMVVSRGTQASDQNLICTYSYPMGSHIPQRICITKEQQEARQKAAQSAMQNLQMQGKESSCAPNCL